MMRVILAFIGLLFASSAIAQERVDSVKLDTAIVRNVDKVPEFVGGVSAWSSFISRSFDAYDVISRLDSTDYVDFGIRQTAIMEFTVCEDGSICDIRVANKDKISPAFAKEVLRVMKRSPKWHPGLKNDKAVRTRIRQNIVGDFELK
ncbi:energy transducer TonB [Sphingobacterium hotanense]|uniref:Energy transducer TonB n=1 Tax=Sphingobacterium hotanense TaxID=649196 RepID=A0ABT7NLM3_9SPHI|nr:energy transducer TonB [Sphingobacterium hotanense]MDM1048161.1 energy transducer TonB [Sphingobacterium hotanense]